MSEDRGPHAPIDPAPAVSGPSFADLAAEDVDETVALEAEATELVETRLHAETVPGTDLEGVDPAAADPIDFRAAMHDSKVAPDVVAPPAHPAG